MKNNFHIYMQWKPSCKANPYAPGMWPSKRGELLSGVQINTYMFRYILASGLLGSFLRVGYCIPIPDF